MARDVVGEDPQRAVGRRSPRRSSRPESSSPSSIRGMNWSVSNTEGLSCRIAAIRFRPRPVSMLFAGSARQLAAGAARRRGAGRTA